MAISCAVDTCDSPRRKREWCDRHYQAWRRHGDPTKAKFSWAETAPACIACGKAEIATGMRQFCSVACRQSEYESRMGKSPKTAESCATCGEALPVGRVDGRSQYRSDRRLCVACRKPRRSYRLAVDILAFYQGTDSGWRLASEH